MTRWEWREDAACAGKPVHWFYPAEPDLRHLALEVCRPCPVKRECRDTAERNHEPEGSVWGGQIRADRRCPICDGPVERYGRYCSATCKKRAEYRRRLAS